MPHTIIGDEAFPLKTYLMRHYPQPQVHVRKKKHLMTDCHVQKSDRKRLWQLLQKFRL